MAVTSLIIIKIIYSLVKNKKNHLLDFKNALIFNFLLSYIAYNYKYSIFIFTAWLLFFRLGDNKVERFAEQVSNLGQSKFPEYFAYGKSTFFIPVDQAFEVLKILSDNTF